MCVKLQAEKISTAQEKFIVSSTVDFSQFTSYYVSFINRRYCTVARRNQFYVRVAETISFLPRQHKIISLSQCVIIRAKSKLIYTNGGGAKLNNVMFFLLYGGQMLLILPFLFYCFERFPLSCSRS